MSNSARCCAAMNWHAIGFRSCVVLLFLCAASTANSEGLQPRVAKGLLVLYDLRTQNVRVCSGRFVRDIEVTHATTGRSLNVRRCHRVFANERETLDEAYPGDILGLVNPGRLQLGDTLCAGELFQYERLPQFPPEHFATFRCAETQRRNQFAAGVQQLAEEGAIQVFYHSESQRGEPILAAVGELPFEVIKYRLETEYNTPVSIDPLPYAIARWIDPPSTDLRKLRLDRDSRIVFDARWQPVVLFRSEWTCNFYGGDNPGVQFRTISHTSNFYDTHERLGPNS